MQQEQTDAKKQQKKLTRVTFTVSPRKGYEPRDILLIDQQQKQKKEKQEKEKELEKQKREKERKRKREENEKEREERNRRFAERKAEKEKQQKLAMERKEANTCKGGCGVVCRVGNNWVGCSHCKVYWMCSKCYKVPWKKGRLTKHENTHKMLKK